MLDHFQRILIPFLLLSVFGKGYIFDANVKSQKAAQQPKKIAKPATSPSLEWDLQPLAFSLLPLSPGKRRKTLLEEVVKGQIWTLDQLQGVVNVNVPVRCTVVKLKGGGLFVYNPVAPTKECISIMKDLESRHGTVKLIVLGSLGLEHKATVGPFSRYFKDAEIYLQRGQWSFPLNLPTSLYGFPFGKVLRDIPLNNIEAPWNADFDHVCVGPLKFKSVGGFGETAFLHRSSGTLLVTDAVVKVEDEPPAIIQEDPRALLFHARDKMTDVVVDTTETRRKGWRRMTLFSLVFFPAGIDVSGVVETFDQLKDVPKDMKLLGDGAIPINGGLYPWSWVRGELNSFKALQGGLLVAPILQKLIMDREPETILDWANVVQRWKFKRIIPCHFSNNIKANGDDFRRAFRFLEPSKNSIKNPLPKKEDLAFLSSLSNIFTKLGVVAESKVRI